MQALGGDLKTDWLSFSDEKRVRGVGDTRRAIQIGVLHYLNIKSHSCSFYKKKIDKRKSDVSKFIFISRCTGVPAVTVRLELH